MRPYFQFVLIFLNFHFTAFTQNVGINNTGAAPHADALLHVDLGTNQSKGFLVTGSPAVGPSVPNLGVGSRLMFYPGKAAFRAGFVDGSGTQWDNANVGIYSVATGYSTTASGGHSTAMGSQTVASGTYCTAMGLLTTASNFNSTAMGIGTIASGANSTAMGHFTTANGNSSTAMGNQTIAGGLSSTAMGNQTNAAGQYSTAMGIGTIASGPNSTAMGALTTATNSNATAMGFSTNASGFYSTAIGRQTIASGEGATATGYNTNASGNYSTAMGVSVSTNGRFGSFIIGDGNPFGGVTLGGFDNEFVARFANGYYLLTSGDNNRTGVRIGAGGNAWLSISDKNRKENFEPLNGDEVLQKIAKMNFTSWNYKMQDPKTYRHYGIMAQDFYNAFGKDKYGTIGNDTTVNPIDMIGIDMAAIQALEKRTSELQQANEDLKITFHAETAELKRRIILLEQLLDKVSKKK